ncbi:phosphatase PAP2 family protein [Kitasatospora misakiensis]|uniref:Phosphatase PAP2 family protein n=1 Tax=Kitasatospora misakiensis TaxID=67330 RepID=A0ABW0WYQ2_9ACTN
MAVRRATPPTPRASRAPGVPPVLTLLLRLLALTAAGLVTWTTLADAAGRRPALPLLFAAWPPPPSAGLRAVLLLVAVAAVASVGALVARHPPPGVPAPASVGTLAAAAVLISAELRGHPADAVLGLATIALVLFDVLPRRPTAPPTAGLALGVGIALHPVALLFLPAVLPGRPARAPARARLARVRPALVALATAAAVHTAVRLADPARTARFHRRFADPAAITDPADLTALALLHRLGLHGGPPLFAGWLAVALAAALLALRRARALAADGQPLLAAGVLGCATAAVAPVAGPADLGWLLLAATGRLGRRPEDRALWPVIAATVALLPATLLDPGIEPVSGLLLRKAPVLVALAAAAVLPFRRRTDPYWRLHRAPGPPPTGRTGRRRYVPLLPARLRPVSRPNPVLELLFIQVGYGVYTYIRNAAPDRVAVATDHARRLYHLEQTLHLDLEPAVNGWALRAGEGLRDAAQEYYKVLHFAVPLAVLLWLYARHPGRYRTARTVLFAATGLALLGFWGYPLAPPRLVPEFGLREDPGGAPADAPLGALTALTNQYAAMPSLHIAWSAWAALVVVTTVRSPWLRALAALYPVTTFVVVLATANHWVLDAVGGVAVLSAGGLVAFLLTGRLLTDRAPAPSGPRPPAPADRPVLGALAHGAAGPPDLPDRPPERPPDLQPQHPPDRSSEHRPPDGRTERRRE